MKHQFNYLFAIASLALFASCERNLYVEPSYVIDDKYMMQQPYEVPLQTGKVSVVTMGEDTLAITDVPLTIQIPLGNSVTTKAEGDGIVVTYADYAKLPEYTAGSAISIKNHTLLFEDSRQADYDYNDLVLHVQTLFDNPNSQRRIIVKVRGLALGSTKQIGFGITDSFNDDYDLTNNVRRDYFKGQGGFINTEKGQPFFCGIDADGSADQEVGATADHLAYTIIHTRKDKGSTADADKMQTGYIQYSINTKNPSAKNNVKFYIKVNEEKFYVGEYNKNVEGSLPYGIRTEECQNFVPLEKVHIADAFPEFFNWKNGKTDFGSITTTNEKGESKTTIYYWNSEIHTNKSASYEFPRSTLWRW